jgi:hypothetical protein
MNKKMITLISAVLLGIVLIPSCTVANVNNPIKIEKEYVNQQILIRAPAYVNKFNTRDVVVLELKYNSTNEIVFSNDYGLRIFEKTADGWTEVKEMPTETFPPDDIILSPSKEMPAVQSVMFFPDLPDFGRKYSLRIYVIGLMSSNGEEIEVAAFTDIELHP